METIFNFLIRASVYLLVFGAGYYFLLADRGSAVFNRFFILLAFVFSLVLSVLGRISMDTFQAHSSEGFLINLPEVIVGAQSGIADAGRNFFPVDGSGDYLFYLLIGVAAIFLILFGLKLFKISRYIRQNPREKLDDVELVMVPSHYTPFSFFRWIFIPGMLKNSDHYEKVITHERAHFILRHSWDIIFMELLKPVFWFHPLYYYLRKELQILHEYDADSFALQKYSRPEYQRALLDFAMGSHFLPVTNPFNVSTIKKRFIMMNTSKIINLRQQWLRACVVIPAVLLVFALQSFAQPAPQAPPPPPVPQQDAPPPPPPPAENEPKMKIVGEQVVVVGYDNRVFKEVETDPEFPGGQMELMKHLQTNLRYPTAAREAGKQGTVFATFIIERDGKLTEIEILRGVSPELDEETIRVIKLMPGWVPGKQGGEPVRVQFTMPVRFVLD
jgi:TonB family protein